MSALRPHIRSSGLARVAMTLVVTTVAAVALRFARRLAAMEAANGIMTPAVVCEVVPPFQPLPVKSSCTN